jgi:type II secretory pathway component PulK
MKQKGYDNGTALLMVVFAIALMTILVTGMLQINTEELQIVHNHVRAAEALATAQAGIDTALAEIREDSGWSEGLTDEQFNGGSYTVAVDGSTITSTGTTAHGFSARVEADITIGDDSPHVVRIDHLRVNQ